MRREVDLVLAERADRSRQALELVKVRVPVVADWRRRTRIFVLHVPPGTVDPRIRRGHTLLVARTMHASAVVGSAAVAASRHAEPAQQDEQLEAERVLDHLQLDAEDVGQTELHGEHGLSNH